MKKLKKLKCKYCDKEFSASKETALYCSSNCRTKVYQEKRKGNGKALSQSTKSSRSIREVNYYKVVKIQVAYSGSYSKNVILGRGSLGRRYYMKREAKDLKKDIHWLIKNELLKDKINFVEDKVWVDIFVQKPNAGAGDAINVIDLICDAISEAIGIDDRWFSIKGLDWEVKKENPKIFIEFGQADNIPKKICSYCGRILPKTRFNKNKSQKDGYSRVCKECIKV